MTSSARAVGRREAVAGRNFGLFADLYDRRRPGYPGGLIEALFEYCRAVPGDAALEIGAGTGQATRAVAARGVRVTAIEPSPELAEIADRNFAIAGLSAETVVTTFEEAVLPEAAYRLIYAATSWHWLDPATRFARAEHAIAPDGTLAVLSTWPRWRATELRPELDAVYQNSGAPLTEMGPMYEGEPDPGALAREWSREIERSTVFAEPKGTLARWSVNYGSRAYADLLGTYGDHIALEPEIRDRLLDGIGAVVEAAGGTIALEYVTLLLMARAVDR